MQHLEFLLSVHVLLSCLAKLSSQVDIEHVIPSGSIRLGWHSISIICSNIAPGVCCRRPVYHRSHLPVVFHHLTAFDIAAVWTRRPLPGPALSLLDPTRPPDVNPECSGSVAATGRGPGTWRWHQHEGPLSDPPESEYPTVQGGSYITLPRALPPDATTANWLTMEGLLGLAWGGGKWFASPAAEALLGRMTILPRGVRQRRDINSPEKGNLYARNPPRAVFPVISIDGTSYTFKETVADDAMYINGAGETLNLTDVFRVPVA